MFVNENTHSFDDNDDDFEDDLETFSENEWFNYINEDYDGWVSDEETIDYTRKWKQYEEDYREDYQEDYE